MIPDRLTAALADRYRLERELGQGGMATVYLAQDLKHQRQVAIKVLKPELAAVLGAERFVQEITTTAQLQHPHILPLFDSGTADGFLYYVMPYIQGETLRTRLDREKQLGVEEAVKITTEVADALDYAHRQGVVHRDIKPENILLHDGRPMVADFGIALALSAAAGGRMTETGLSLGTPHYMSPEQATAEKEITARSDVYSLASVLYEMLAGQPPHLGGSAQQIIMKIIAEPVAAVTSLRKSVPPNVAAALAQALEKLPADRFDSAKAFAEALANPAFQSATLAAGGHAPAPAGRRAPLVWALASTTVILAVALAWVLMGRRAAAPAVSLHAFLSDTTIQILGGGGVAISPDGSKVFISRAPFVQGDLFLRAADDDGFRVIAGVSGVGNPLVSPDGKFVLFQALSDGHPVLRRMPLSGGPAVTLADSVTAAGWCDDGSLIVGRRTAILRVTEGGTAPVTVIEMDSVPIRRPWVLPDCRGLLFTDGGGGNGRLLLLDFETGAVTQLHEQGDGPRYVPSGHILFASNRPVPALMALPFDLRRHRVTGPPIMMVPQVGSWDISHSGTLVYIEVPREALGGERLVWMDMSGRATPLPIQLADFEQPRLAPGGRRIAFVDFNARTLLLYDVSTGATTKLVGPVSDQSWSWSADGKALYVSTDRMILRIRTDGTGMVDTVYRGEGRVFAASPDQSRLVIGVEAPGRGWDIDILRIDGGEPAVEPYLRANWDERQPALSPDGRWLAYVSNESGSTEVYVRAFPVPGDPVRISDGGGVGPAWAPDGAAVYYAGPEVMMKVQLAAGASGLAVRSRTRLFPHKQLEVTTQGFFQRSNMPRRWDLGTGGDRFLMVSSTEEVFDVGVNLRVITNFYDEIRRRTVAP
jgi:Tol biopolymer transport system component/tRNA A-37 threonylcarbamoyl transferase component Bud32